MISRTTMTLFPLRPHQQTAIDGLRQSLSTGHRRPTLQLPTGAGKTVVAAHIIQSALDKRKRIAFAVPALSLIDQTFARFSENGIHPGDMGVMQGDHPWRRPNAPVQICSIQTIAKRGFPDVDFAIVDENHLRFEAIDRWMAEQADKIFVGLSATPWARGMGDFWDDLIIPTSIAELIEEGYLSKFRVFAPTHPDLSGVKIVAGDYHEGQLRERMSGAKIVADVVTTWLEKGEDQPTLCFTVDRGHAQALHDQFAAVGIASAYVDANSDREERARVIGAFQRGEIKVINSIGTMCLDDQTEILTTSGWIGIDEMSYDHVVAAWSEDGIEFTKPMHIVRRDRGEDERMVVLDCKHHNVRVTSNHRMMWSSQRKRFYEKSAGDIVGAKGFVPTSGFGAPLDIEMEVEDKRGREARIRGLSYKWRKAGWSNDDALKRATDHQDHLRDFCATKPPHLLSLDECMFIGFWIGDGTKSKARYSIVQSVKYAAIIEWFEGVLTRTGIRCAKLLYGPSNKSTNDSVRWCFVTGRGGGAQKVVGGISPLMEYLNKDGSNLFWGFDNEQFRALMHGYWMADGNHGLLVGKERGHKISGLSLKLFSLLQAIGACRGMRFSIARVGRTDMIKPFYRMTWHDGTAARVGNYTFSFEEGFKKERVWCITSTTGNLITRRGGKVTVMGNTTGVDVDCRCIIMARPTKSEILFVQMIGRGLRTAPGKDFCKILDHSDNHLRLGMVTDIHHDRLRTTKGEAERKANGEKSREATKPFECPKCTCLIQGRECPSCGWVSRRANKVEVADGELRELGASGPRLKREPAVERLKREGEQAIYSQLLGMQGTKKDGWVSFKFKEIWGHWPPRSLLREPAEPSNAMQSWIRSGFIKWAKTRPRDAVEAMSHAAE